MINIRLSAGGAPTPAKTQFSGATIFGGPTGGAVGGNTGCGITPASLGMIHGSACDCQGSVAFTGTNGAAIGATGNVAPGAIGRVPPGADMNGSGSTGGTYCGLWHGNITTIPPLGRATCGVLATISMAACGSEPRVGFTNCRTVANNNY